MSSPVEIETDPIPELGDEMGALAQGDQDDWWGKATRWWDNMIASSEKAGEADQDARAAQPDLRQSQKQCEIREEFQKEIVQADRNLDRHISNLDADWNTVQNSLLNQQKQGHVSQEQIDRAFYEYLYTRTKLEETKGVTRRYFQSIEAQDKKECVVEMQRVSGHKSWSTFRPAARQTAIQLKRIPQNYYTHGIVRRRTTLGPVMIARVKAHNALLSFETKYSGKVHAFASTNLDAYLGKLPPPPT